MQRPPIIPTLLFCLVTTVTYKYNNVNYALFLCSLGRLTHCRSQFSLFLPVLRFASSATGGAQLRTPAGEPFGAVYNSHIKPALKGEVDMSVSEWTEGLKKERRFSLYRQPLSQ